jgi:lipid-A-disaccharide synthase
VLEWANLALCVSGTVSLHVMNHATPMIGMYKVNAFSMLLAKMLLNTPHRLLPNIIAGTQIVPEFIPCLECASTIAEVAIKLLSNEESMHAIQSRLQKEAAIYAEHNPSKESAELILSFTQ